MPRLRTFLWNGRIILLFSVVDAKILRIEDGRTRRRSHANALVCPVPGRDGPCLSSAVRCRERAGIVAGADVFHPSPVDGGTHPGHRHAVSCRRGRARAALPCAALAPGVPRLSGASERDGRRHSALCRLLLQHAHALGHVSFHAGALESRRFRVRVRPSGHSSASRLRSRGADSSCTPVRLRPRSFAAPSRREGRGRSALSHARGRHGVSGARTVGHAQPVDGRGAARHDLRPPQSGRLEAVRAASRLPCHVGGRVGGRRVSRPEPRIRRKKVRGSRRALSRNASGDGRRVVRLSAAFLLGARGHDSGGKP